jgi:hypothetical protein
MGLSILTMTLDIKYMGTEKKKLNSGPSLCCCNGKRGSKCLHSSNYNGPGAVLSRAVTRDITGNGYLDRLDLFFD